jgi:hypothetical protein
MNLIFGSMMLFLASPLASFLGNKQAYLDPGSGSYLLQLLIAALLGSVFVIRASWSRITGFFKRNSEEEASPEGEEDTPSDE